MPATIDGPASSAFAPVALRGNRSFAQLAEAGLSPEMTGVLAQAPEGDCVCWGLPFRVRRPVVLADKPVTVKLGNLQAPWLVFMHTSDLRQGDADVAADPMNRGVGRLAEVAANYVIVYADGTEVSLPIRRRHQIGSLHRHWGENCFEAVAHRKIIPVPANHERPTAGWGHSQTRVATRDSGVWINWLWAWENPHPRKAIAAIRFEPVSGRVLVSAVTAGKASQHPLRWQTRQKAVLTLPRGEVLQAVPDANGLLPQIQLDMGQVISARLRPVYPNERWGKTYNNAPPVMSEREVLVEYTAHPDARFHLPGGKTVPVSRLARKTKAGPLEVVAPATQRVTIRAVEKASRRPVPVKLHLHGEAGEYLAPVDRHRLPNPSWYEDWSVDYTNERTHWYRYLNCGCMVAAVGGTDKMSADTAVGAVRTYAQITPGEPFTYEAWKDAVRAGRTFVTYGPLLEWSVAGQPPGARLSMKRSGGTVDVTWSLASVTVPMSRIELIVNGEIRESRALRPWEDAGQWSVKVDRSSWLALLVRGHYADRPEIIAAHSSPVMVDVAGTRVVPAADAISILDQIEGALAYLDTVGTRAETKALQRMRLVLTGAHRSLHNRLHQQGAFHEHTPVTDHREHH